MMSMRQSLIKSFSSLTGLQIGQTFKSYVDDEDDNDEELSKRASSFFQSNLAPRLLQGEREVTEADSVLCFAPFTDRKQGISGKLFITNFKITFQTADRSSYDGPQQRQRNKFIDDGDIPLTSIDSIYQVVSGGKRRKLTPGTTVSTLTKYLEIHCKDFRVHVFGFKFCPKDQIKKATNAIVHHAFPTKSYLLYAFEFGKQSQNTVSERVCDTPLFDNPSDWERELNRCRCTKWRVSDVNSGYSVSQSMPERFILPCSLMNNDLMKAASQFTENRLPAWCYTHSNGASLVRMAELIPDSDMTEYQEKLLVAIQLADVNKGYPIVLDLGKHCPSLRDVQQSFEKLKELIFIDTRKDFAVHDVSWMSLLENTKWLSCVSQCLHTACDVAEHLQQHTVIIQEFDSRNFCCLISSLAQILLDRNFRTRIGFQSLIQREWVAMGYPFQRQGFIIQQQTNSEYIPLFLLFLDCVWQLMEQFPSSFSFSETYLVTLWDSVHLGIFETFLFDSCHQRSRFHIDGRCQMRFRLPSVWDWRLQFSEDDQSFFNNPLYIMQTNQQIKSAVNNARKLLSSLERKLSRDELYSFRLGSIHENNLDITTNSPASNTEFSRLQPQTSVAVIKLWSQCYIRWQTPAQIIGGGNPCQYLQQCVMVEEIMCLQHKLESMQKNNKNSNFVSRPRSDLVFSMALDTPRSPELLKTTFLTSSFPFSPARSSKEEQMVFTPISLYLENSAIDYDYTNDED